MALIHSVSHISSDWIASVAAKVSVHLVWLCCFGKKTMALIHSVSHISSDWIAFTGGGCVSYEKLEICTTKKSLIFLQPQTWPKWPLCLCLWLVDKTVWNFWILWSSLNLLSGSVEDIGFFHVKGRWGCNIVMSNLCKQIWPQQLIQGWRKFTFGKDFAWNNLKKH